MKQPAETEEKRIEQERIQREIEAEQRKKKEEQHRRELELKRQKEQAEEKEQPQTIRDFTLDSKKELQEECTAKDILFNSKTSKKVLIEKLQEKE